MLVIYTADVRREQTESRLDAGCLLLKTTEAFLSEIDSERIRRAGRQNKIRTEAYGRGNDGVYNSSLTYKGRNRPKKLRRLWNFRDI